MRDDVHICAAVHVCEITTICERTRRLKGKGQSSAPLKKLQAISQTDSLASAALDRSTYEWTTMSYARSGDDEQKLNVLLVVGNPFLKFYGNREFREPYQAWYVKLHHRNASIHTMD